MAKQFNSIRLLLILSLTFGLYQCAQKRPLTGGVKDVTPPRLIKAHPDTFSTNFNSDNIRFDFDEFVKLDNISKNLLITPVLREEPTVVAVGKRILVKRIDDSLWANTTYVMEFNEAIKDITENNAKKGFRYVFSTGDYLDSLQIKGQIKDAFTLKPMEDVYVFLYEDDYDSIPYLEKPRYIGRSDKDGFFKIQNMKKGDYKVFMTTDENRNYIYDRASGKIDFLDSMISVSSDSGKFILGHVFQEKKGIQGIEGYGLLNKWAFYISFRRSVDTLEIKSSGDAIFPSESFKRSYNQERDSVVFWLQDSSKWDENLDFIIKADTFPSDTLKLVHYEDKPIKYMNIKQNLFGKFLDLGEDLELNFDFPIISLDEEKIKILSDSVELPISMKFNGTRRKLTISAEWQEKRQFKLIMDTAAFIDINGTTNDSTVRQFENRELKYYGTMDISLRGLQKGKGILMLLSPKGEEMEKVLLDNEENYYFQYLYPGNYLLKYIVDENGNGKWDPGDYLEKRHAEPVFIYQGEITIRSNWDQVIEWKFK